VISDRIARASCFLFESTEQAMTFARWIAARAADIRAWLHADRNPL